MCEKQKRRQSCFDVVKSMSLRNACSVKLYKGTFLCVPKMWKSSLPVLFGYHVFLIGYLQV